MVRIEIPRDEKLDDMIDSLEDHLKEMKDEVSELRRQGIDTTIVDMMMMDILPKVRMAKITNDQQDVDAVKRLLARMHNEVDELKTGTEFDEALKKIQSAYDSIRGGKYRDAWERYTELRGLYKKLPEDLRRIVYVASLDIHQKLQQAE
ncbi:hypothetical protein KY349_05770 [Candidatus Woesearchaeota archaeon]|jgi:type VI protein secretion system component VasK|nr:hypothetical protein [Candidatus Woesearchaeota archaeon]